MRKGGPGEDGVLIRMSCRQDKILFGVGKGGGMMMIMIEMDHCPEMEAKVKWQRLKPMGRAHSCGQRWSFPEQCSRGRFELAQIDVTKGAKDTGRG